VEIEKNLICYTSEIGHNNFWYPSNKKIVLKKDCEAELMSWIGGGFDYTPVKVKKSCLMPVDICESTARTLSPPSEDGYTVVWIERNV
jgi:hypothetical protein